MFNLPRSTEIKKPIHKTAIFQRFKKELSGDAKSRFDDDISKITIINEISENSVKIKATEEISSIFVVLIEIKTKDYNDKNLILLSKLFGQNLLFVLHYEDEYQLAIYEIQLLKSEWKKKEDINLRIEGLDLSEVWADFVTAVSGIQAEGENTLYEQIGIEIQIDSLKKRINSLKEKARKEIQSKKKYELHEEIQENLRVLEELNGQTEYANK